VLSGRNTTLFLALIMLIPASGAALLTAAACALLHTDPVSYAMLPWQSTDRTGALPILWSFGAVLVYVPLATSVTFTAVAIALVRSALLRKRSGSSRGW
jgi:hypothetical protein